MIKPAHISISYDQIRATEHFKKLDKIQQKMILNKRNRMTIENSVNITANRGLDFWEENAGANYNLKKIVKELIEESNKKQIQKSIATTGIKAEAAKRP